MSVFLYTRQDTFLHRLNPVVKICVLVLFFLVIGFINTIPALLTLLSAILGLFIAGKSTGTIRRMAVILGLIGCTTFLLWLCFYNGPAAARFTFATAMGLRFVVMLLAGLLFLSTISIEEFWCGLLLCGIPYPIAFAVSLSFRLVNVFIATGFSIVEAQKVRGNNAEQGSIFKRIQAYIPLLVPLILTGIKKAELLSLALESKGFSPKTRIDVSPRYPMRAMDWLVLGISIVGLGIGLWKRTCCA